MAAWVIPLALVVASVVSTLPARADAQAGFQDFSYATSGHAQVTYGKPESKLWFNDGTWWGVLLPKGKGFHIYRFDPATQAWMDTGTLVDSRRTTRQDVLWDGTHLYVASHVQCQNCSNGGSPSRLWRFSFHPDPNTYTVDAGFPVQINNTSSETLVIDKDSTGRLWATWVQGPSGNRQVYVAATNGTDKKWGAPFPLPLDHVETADDDISSILAFGSKIGVMWGNQLTDSFYLGVHPDAQAPSTGWTEETALSGSNMADDHINLKADGNTVYAAVKTSVTAGDSPLIELLVRSSPNVWTAHPVSDFSEHETRPILLLDPSAGTIDIFLTGPPHGGGGTDSGGSIYEKTTTMASPSFDRKDNGVMVIHDPTNDIGDNVNNPTSTKQSVSAQTGELVEASNAKTMTYWHAWTPQISVANSKVREGDTGTKTMGFAVTVTGARSPVHAQYDVTAGTARVGTDFVASSGTLTIPPDKRVKVTVKGDRTLEHDETLFIRLSSSPDAFIDDGRGKGVIRNDDTKTRLWVGRRHGRIRPHGLLSPAHPSDRMVVKLFRKEKGAFVKLAKKRPLLSGRTDVNDDGFTDSRYSTSFERPKPGTCRVVARFPGDGDHGPSHATKEVAC